MILPKNPFAKTNHFGVSLSDTSIRGLSLDSRGALQAMAEVSLGSPIISGQTARIDSLTQAIGELKRQGHFISPYAAVCLPEKYAFSREYSLPLTNFAEINEALTWQIEKIFPFQKQDIYFDWKLLHQSKIETQVLVTAIQKKFLDSLKDAFEQAGLYPISFEPSASALSRLVPPKAATRLIIIEVETGGTTATLVINDISTLTTTTIITPTTPPAVVLQDILTSLTALINRAKSADTATNPLSLVLTGEKATPQLAALLSREIKLPTTILSVPELTPAYHLAYVAATSTILPPASERSINLLPTTLQEYYQAKIQLSTAKSAIKILVPLFSLSLLISLLTLSAVAFATVSLNRQIAQAQAEPLPPGPEGLNLASVQNQAQRFIQLFTHKTTPENSLATILTQIPSGITLTHLTYEAKTNSYRLGGIARSRTDILNLKQQLDDTQLFSKVVLPLSALENASDYNFLVTFKVKKTSP